MEMCLTSGMFSRTTSSMELSLCPAMSIRNIHSMVYSSTLRRTLMSGRSQITTHTQPMQFWLSSTMEISL
ncbi:hypothetical protein C0J52_20511 [Blattella germanica]|nr:hypothetical protein C0J52_20511 [Blattella germanica]